jgi:hypothetical protein
MFESRSPARTRASFLVLALVFFALYAIAYVVCLEMGWSDFKTGAQSALLSLMVAQVAESRFKQWRLRRIARRGVPSLPRMSRAGAWVGLALVVVSGCSLVALVKAVVSFVP